MEDSFQQIWQGFLNVWNFLLLKIETHGITVKTIIIGIIVLIVGFKLAKIIRLIVRKRLLARKTISLNAVVTIVGRLEAKSDIRYKINDILTEAGIVIAFPQTDVHLDTTKPIDLRITKNA